MKNSITDFHKLFTADVAEPAVHVLNKVKKYVTDYMNDSLLASYTEEVVKKALFNIFYIIMLPNCRVVTFNWDFNFDLIIVFDYICKPLFINFTFSLTFIFTTSVPKYKKFLAS